MATRMQQRKGTAAQWTAADPILNAGEIGWESDTNKFKIGDGTNHWEDLTYFLDGTDTGFNAADYVLVTSRNEVNGVAILDANINVVTTNAVVFEGVTADAYETKIEIATEPTADRTIGLPDVDGTVVTTGNLSSITTVGVLTQPIVIEGTNQPLIFEGATANDFETTLAVIDPTADRTITLPDVTGTVITTGNLSGITSLGTISSIVFEGSTADEFELTLAGGDPTADRTVSFPDAGGVVVVDTAAQTLTNKTLTSPHVSNLIITDGSIVLEGSTPNDFETTLSVTDPTADRTISFPDVTGTVVTTGDTGSVTSTMILDGTIVDGDINASAAIAQSKISGLTTDLGNKQDKIAGVSDTEIGYLSAVTSDIQAQLDAKLALAGGTMTGAIAMGTNKITGLGTPTDSADAVTKAYVDALGEGLHIHASVVAATTANITLATDVENGDTLDGVTLATGNRILVKNQSTASENGIYVVAASGAPSRAADFDSPAEIDGGDFVFVTGGTANDNKGFVQINTVGTIGTDAIEFSQFSGAGTFVAGNGLTLTDNSFSIDTSITADLSTAQTLTNKTLTSPKINLGINAQSDTTYTFVLGDAGKFITANNSSPITVTIPPSGDVAYPVGSQLNIIQKGTGQVTFAQGSGVTINSTGATATAPKLRVRYSSATAVYEGSNVWYVVGDIS
jgi:hypothetical protein